MSHTPSDSPAPSPSKHASSGGGGSAFKSKIAAFESGAAANASKKDQSKHIPHADLSNLRSRFDNKGEKPLEVKGSFGLGVAPPAAPGGRAGGVGGSGGRDGHRAVSLGIGRAVSPMQSPSVIAPGTGPSLSTSARSASSTTLNSTASGNNSETRFPPTATSSLSSRPQIPRSDSTNSNSTSATSTSISGATAASTNSSLLPGPLAALRASGSTPHPNSPYGGDDSTSTGLRTPMSSISLSSLAVETGSTAGDIASSSGDTTANEDDARESSTRNDVATTPHGEKSEIESQEARIADGSDTSAQQATSATVDDQQPPKEAVERAAEELDKYTLEEASTTAVTSPSAAQDTPLQPSISLTQLASFQPKDTTNGNGSDEADKIPSPAPSSARKSLSRASSSAFSPQDRDRLKRSSTANSIASHPESDLADTNLESFDQQQQGDNTKAKKLADIIVPSPSRSRKSSEPPSTPSRSRSNAAPTSGKTSPLDALLAEEQDFLPIDVVEDEQDEVDEEGMPLVKCSDCGAKVSLVKLGEHICAASTPAASKIAFPSTSPNELRESPNSASFRDRRETGPEDVPTGALSPETIDSPNMSHRSINSSRPDVPDDEALSVASIDGRLDDTHLDDTHESPARHDRVPNVPTDSEEVEEDYMTALTSRRDSTDPSGNGTQRPTFTNNDSYDNDDSSNYSSNSNNLPESISDPRLYDYNTQNNNDEDDETEELAIPMAEHPVDTPRMGSFGTARQLYPDSPTPDPRHLPGTSTNGAGTTPQKAQLADKLATPSHDFPGAPGVRRRSSAGRRAKTLGDTDSEGEIEPGTVTIIR